MLYIVATPIGNLEDITVRAIRLLGEVDIIVCEDTRVTQKLLKRYNISNQLFSWHANSSQSDLERIVDWLNEGKQIAYVSDAGTPGVSDPGVVLVREVRARLPQIKISSVPGPSALTAAISVSGIPLSEFLWLGFLPHKKGRLTALREMLLSNRPTIFYESPHRVEKMLEQISTLVNENQINKKITIIRELTKIYEEVITGSADELLGSIKARDLVVKGEFVIIIS